MIKTITSGLLLALVSMMAANAKALTHDELQWQGFGNRVIEFSGYPWRAKQGGLFGPGNNYFSESEDNIRVDERGWLHLRITRRDGKWYCPELALVDALGYGDYIFKTVGRVDRIDPNLIFGLFLWEYQEQYPSNEVYNGANEFDIEFGTWKDPKRAPAQFVCQPWQGAGNEHRFDPAIASDDAKTSHAFRWHPGGIDCRSWRGHSDTPKPGDIVLSWVYDGKDSPRPEAPRVHLNLWCIEEPPSDGQEHEVILAGFTFIPEKPARSLRPWWKFW